MKGVNILYALLLDAILTLEGTFVFLLKCKVINISFERQTKFGSQKNYEEKCILL